jgi:hypothetical protein
MGAHVPDAMKQAVRERAGDRCEYCLIHQAGQVATFHIDHCIPLHRGGETEVQNLALACPRCNASKGPDTDAIDPLDHEVVPLFNPRTQSWSDHFRWSSDYLTIEGNTPTGRATVDKLKMSTGSAPAIRALMINLGLHPPLHRPGGG